MREKENIKEIYKDDITFLDTKEKSYILNMLKEEEKNKYKNRVLCEKDVYKISIEAYSVLDKLLKLPLISVAYGRVSTNHEDQQNSLESQIYYFQNILSESSLWTLKSIYADQGISGTQFKNRKAFNKMIDDALENKFDLILIKDVSRFARNTVDCLQTIRKLSQKGVIVYFITDRIISIEQDAEIRITEAVKHAQEESRRQSVKVKWGMDSKAKMGNPLGRKCFGFELEKNKLVISQYQAELIKEWGRLVLAHYSQYQIRKEMERRSIKTPSGLDNWDNVDIYEMLKNPKLRGDSLYKKDIVINYLEHKTIKNDGRVPTIYKKNTHEPIFTEEEHSAIIKEIESRSPVLTEEEKRKFTNRYALSGKVICGTCNHTYYRKAYHRKKEKENFVWCCSENIRNGLPKKNEKGDKIGCDNKGIHEPILQRIFMQALQYVLTNKEQIVKDMKTVIDNILAEIEPLNKVEEKLNKELFKIKKNKMNTVELYNDNSIDKNTMLDMLNEYSSRESDVLNQLENVKNKVNQDDMQVFNRKDNLSLFIEKVGRFSVDDFNEIQCRDLLYKMIVYNRTKIAVYIKGEEGSPDFFDGSPPLLMGQEDQRGTREPQAQKVRMVQHGCLAQRLRQLREKTGTFISILPILMFIRERQGLGQRRVISKVLPEHRGQREILEQLGRQVRRGRRVTPARLGRKVQQVQLARRVLQVRHSQLQRPMPVSVL